MKNLTASELNQLQAEALQAYTTSAQAKLDRKYGECQDTKQLKGNFKGWLASKVQSKKDSVMDELREVKPGSDKAKVLSLMNDSFDKYQVLVNLIREAFN